MDVGYYLVTSISGELDANIKMLYTCRYSELMSFIPMMDINSSRECYLFALFIWGD